MWCAVEGSQPRLPSEEGKGLHQRAWFRTCQMVFKSDQKPTILDLVKEITRLRSPTGTLREKSPLAASASNRVGVQTVQGKVRLLKDAFETQIGTTVNGS